MIQKFPKEPRWAKVVQHLKEKGELSNTVKDIGRIIPELEKDFEEECSEIIKDLLWTEYRRRIISKAKFGFVDWYKNRLSEL